LLSLAVDLYETPPFLLCSWQKVGDFDCSFGLVSGPTCRYKVELALLQEVLEKYTPRFIKMLTSADPPIVSIGIFACSYVCLCSCIPSFFPFRFDRCVKCARPHTTCARPNTTAASSAHVPTTAASSAHVTIPPLRQVRTSQPPLRPSAQRVRSRPRPNHRSIPWAFPSRCSVRVRALPSCCSLSTRFLRLHTSFLSAAIPTGLFPCPQQPQLPFICFLFVPCAWHSFFPFGSGFCFPFVGALLW
jgi:hypothetical protein